MNSKGTFNRMRRVGRSYKNLTIVAIVLASLVALNVGLFAVWNFTPFNAHGCVVNDKDRSYALQGKSSRSDYRIYTDNCGVLRVNDNLFGLQFNAADKYNDIKVGETYDFSGRGFRAPIISMFPNIEEAHLVK